MRYFTQMAVSFVVTVLVASLAMAFIGSAAMLGGGFTFIGFVLNALWMFALVALVMSTSSLLPFFALRATMFFQDRHGRTAFAVAGALCALAAIGALIFDLSPVCLISQVCQSSFGPISPVLFWMAVSGALSGLCYHYIERFLGRDGAVLIAGKRGAL